MLFGFFIGPADWCCLRTVPRLICTQMFSVRRLKEISIKCIHYSQYVGCNPTSDRDLRLSGFIDSGRKGSISVGFVSFHSSAPAMRQRRLPGSSD